jgi:hypothetical protein
MGRRMIKRALLVVTLVSLALVAAAYVMYATNRAPVVPRISASDAAEPGRPYVVKLHAQWCAVCMVTKGVWSEVEAIYAPRVNLVVFDFTDQATTDASRAEARRLGLEQLFDQREGESGTVVVLDGRTREVTASIHGSRDLAEYRAAIDAALKPTP